MTLHPHAPIFKPTTCSRLFTIYRLDLLTKMEASTSQDIIDLTIPTKCPKTSPDSNSPTVSEQLHLLTSQVGLAIFHLLAYRPAAIFLSVISLPFPYASLFFPSCLARIILNPLLSFRGRNYSKTILVVLLTNFAAYRPNRPALHFLPNDLIGSHLNGGHLENSSINNQRTARVFIRFLAYFPEANLPSTSLPSIFWKYSKTFHQQPENIQRLFRLQNCLSRKSSTIFRHYSKTFWAAAINSSNQQQQSTAATSSSNQQQLSTAAINSSYQQQESTAAINSSNQQ